MPKYTDILEAKKLADEFKLFTQRFILHPDRLNGLTLPVPLEWKRIKFSESNKEQVAKVRGVYAFAIGSDNEFLPPHGYVAYIGETNRTLQERYVEYIQDFKKPKSRPYIYAMLKDWENCLYFYFAEINDNDIETKEIERLLSDAMLTPKLDKDFSPVVRQAKSIWDKS